MNGSALAPAIEIRELSFRYGTRAALDGVSLTVARGELFAFLGPNGGGKSTLFRLLTTLIPLQQGEASIFGTSLRGNVEAVRSQIGVVFQSPSLDRKLTVAENMQYQAALYGFRGHEARQRIDRLLAQLGLRERRRDLVETLSGGLRRRVEIAKGMLHDPQLLLMDEPSTGLDPGARSDLWTYLVRLRDEQQVTVVLTTHLLDEADRCDRIAILDHGRIVALDVPTALRTALGGDTITVETDQPETLAAEIQTRFGLAARVLPGAVRLEQKAGQQWVVRLVEAFPENIRSITLGKPTLEDVFIAKTGHRFWNESPGAAT